MRINRWLGLSLIAVSLASLAHVAGDFLEDRRVRMRTLIKLDPPPSPAVVRLDGHTISVTGAFVKQVRPGRLHLRAWGPTPTIRVTEPGGSDPVTVLVENLPLRVRLEASGPLEEERQGLTRTLRFSPGAVRRIAFSSREREVTFAVLGDTGSSPPFPEALRLAAMDGADFFLVPGDLIYDDDQLPEIEKILRNSPLPVFVARGNHDYRNEERINFMRALSPPYYSFEMGGATFVILDNSGTYVPTFWRRSTQYRWLTAILGVPRDGPLFIVMHKQLFDRRPGRQGSPIEDETFGRQLMQDFVAAGVDAVFTGHAHASHIWIEDGIPYVISGEGFMSPEGPDRNRMAWVRVRGWEVTFSHVPIWRK